MPSPINPLYGGAGAGDSRFAVAGDLRRMYPVGAAGGLFAVEQLGQKVQSGSAFSYFTGVGGDLPTLVVTDVFGSQNMISNGSALYTLGEVANVDADIRAWRLGVTTASGGNSVPLAFSYGTIVTNGALGVTVRRTVLYAGEAIYQDTTPATPTFGASVEQFTVNVGGTVTTTAASGSVQGNGTTFTTATLLAAGKYPSYVGNLPSHTLLQAGDIIRVENTAGTAWSLHRITSVNAASGAGALTVTPVVPNAGTTRPYTLYRSGFSSNFRSQVVSINDGNDNYYNYYVGSARTSWDMDGTIQCFSRPEAGGTAVHWMAPQTTSTGGTVNVADVVATDIIYYKGFLLYGNRGAISWSVAGFPTGGFGANAFGPGDFPASNISVVDNTDIFLGFEFLGDSLIALFENGLWEVQATGSVPEFNFYKLPEVVGVHAPALSAGGRQTCSGRNAIFYWSNNGLMQLSGGTATNVSLKVFSAIQRHFGGGGAPQLTWEPTTDSVYVMQRASGTGFIYNVQTETWSYLNLPAIDASALGYCMTGNMYPDTAKMSSGWYDATDELINWHHVAVGGPWYPAYVQPGASNTNSIWATPIVGLGDEYGAFPMAGFQLDGVIGTNTGTWTMYAGRTPYAMEVVQTGTLDYIDNRRLLGKKMDVAFIAFVVQLTGVNGSIINGINIYPQGGGK